MGKNFSVINSTSLTALQNGTGLAYSGTPAYGLIEISVNTDKWVGLREGMDPASKKIIEGIKTTTIVGIMNGKLGYSLSSEWSSMDFPLTVDLGAIGDIHRFAGGGSAGEVYKSTKIWKNSGDISLSPSFRIYDTNGDGASLSQARALMRLCTSYGESVIGQELITALTETGQEFVDVTSGIIQKGLDSKAVKFITSNDPTHLSGAVVDFAGSVATSSGPAFKQVSDGIADQTTLRYSPPVVKVKIGNIFDHEDMVITKIDLEFSDEVSDKGPLYLDVTLSLESRKIVSSFVDSGLADGSEEQIKILFKNTTPGPTVADTQKEINETQFD